MRRAIVTDPDPTPPSEARRGIRRRWFVSVTAGEFLGFAVPAVVGAATAGAPSYVMATALVGAGLVEGGVLGWSQARVLRTVVPGLRAADWVAATVLGALIAWSVGAVPMLTDGLSGWSAPVVIPAAVAGGAVLLLSIGVCQWRVLRRYVSGAARWIGATALAWLAGLAAFTAFTTPLWQPGQDAPVIAIIGALGGLLMAAVMAAITGWFLKRILTGA